LSSAKPGRYVEPVRAPAGFSGHFLTDIAARALFAEGAGIYRIVPAAVAVPASPADVRSLLLWALETGTALVPRGAGSGMPGHNVGAGVVVELRRAYPAALEVDPARRTVRSSAGCTWRDINDAAATHALRLPPDPSSGAFCTLGGMLATNAAGARSLKYGSIREWVERLDYLTPDGERGTAAASGDAASVMTAAGARAAALAERAGLTVVTGAALARKNSSGYSLRGLAEGDLRHVLTGSEGTLAIVEGATLRLAPLPDERQTLLATFDDLEMVAAAVLALGEHEPSTAELLDRTWLDFVRAAAHGHLPARTEAVLIVELEGDASGALRALRPFATTIQREDDPAAAGRLWEIRHMASPTLAALPDHMRSLQIVEDGCVPLGRLGEYVVALRTLAREHEFDVVIFGHAGDGHLHANILADTARDDLPERLDSLLVKVAAAQIALGGTVSGEHGDGRLRARFAAAQHGAERLEVFRAVKAAFDPAGVLNPGVKLPAEGAAGALRAGELKVGRAAPPLPGGVAPLLRRVEREALWGEDLLGGSG
jgi:FAD/FMN-containing dehydrogenase